MAPHPPRNQSLQDHRGGPMSTIWKVLLAKPGPLVGWCDDEEDVVRTGQGGEFRDRDPDELADRRSPQPAAFRDRPQRLRLDGSKPLRWPLHGWPKEHPGGARMTADLPGGRSVRDWNGVRPQSTSYARSAQLRRDVRRSSGTPRDGC